MQVSRHSYEEPKKIQLWKRKRKKRKSRKEFNREWKLIQSFVFHLADYLRDELDLLPSVALQKAWMTERLLEKLGKRKVSFMYRKDDQTMRSAVGTLCPEASERLRHWLEEHSLKDAVGEIKQNNQDFPNHFVYWDEKVNGFRTFKAENLIWYDEDDE